MGLLGILLGFGLLVWLSYRGWSVLVLAPAAAVIAAVGAGEPLLAHWTRTFMGAAGGFVARFFPLFLLGALFGKLMDDSGSSTAIARFMTDTLGERRAVLAVVLAGALVTYGGLGVFAAFFMLAPMAQALFRAADVPNRLMPAAITLGAATFTMSALPGTPSVRNAVPRPYFGTTPFAAPGLGVVAALITLGFGLWWLARAQAAARRAGEGYGDAHVAPDAAADDLLVRERATVAYAFDPAEIHHGRQSHALPGAGVAALPLLMVILVNLAMSQLVLPRLDTTFLADDRWGATPLDSVSGVWSVIVALAAAIATIVVLNRRRLPALRDTVDAGANASALPVVSVASLVGYGAVVAAMPAFAVMRDWVLSIAGGPFRGKLARLVDRLELAARPCVEVHVGRRQGNERHGKRVDDPGDEIERSRRRVRDEDEESAEERAGRERQYRAHPDQRSDPQPAAAHELAAPTKRMQGRAVLELHDLREQRPANDEPDGDRDEESGRRQRGPGAHGDAEGGEEGADSRQRDPVGPDRPDRAARVDLDESARGRGLDQAQSKQRQGRPDHDEDEDQRARRLPFGLDAEQPESAEEELLEQRRHEGDRDQEQADAEEERRTIHVHTGGG